MADEIRDPKIPLQDNGTGDFAVVTGKELVRQRVTLGMRTLPGGFHDLPDWGAGMELELNRKPTPDTLVQARLRAERFLQDLNEVTRFEVTVTRSVAKAIVVNVVVQYDGREVRLPEIEIA